MSTSQQTPDRDPNFVPPHCANRHCRFHLEGGASWRFRRNGFYTRRSDGCRFQLFLCLDCGQGFSTRAFCTDYWLRKRDLPEQVAKLVSNGTGLRQAARCLGTTHSTIARHLARLGRHCLLFQRKRLEGHVLEEAVVVDGFESFEWSQYFPYHLNLAVGAESWFLYDFTDAPLRRKGRMTAEQKLRRARLEAELGRPDPKAVENAMTDLIRSLCQHVPVGGRLKLRSDQHTAYPRAVKRVQRELKENVQIDHDVTSSKEARTHFNPLFPVNLTDLLLRHSQGNHRRETIAYDKRRMAGISRASVFQVWRNWIKKRRENGGKQTTAMEIGLTRSPMRWRDILRRRLFPGRQVLEGWRQTYYEGRVWTQALKDRQRFHDLLRAF